MWILTQSGLPERDAQFAMLAASRFTVGSVLEEQAEMRDGAAQDTSPALPAIDHARAFEEGLGLIVDGLSARVSGAR